MTHQATFSYSSTLGLPNIESIEALCDKKHVVFLGAMANLSRINKEGIYFSSVPKNNLSQALRTEWVALENKGFTPIEIVTNDKGIIVFSCYYKPDSDRRWYTNAGIKFPTEPDIFASIRSNPVQSVVSINAELYYINSNMRMFYSYWQLDEVDHETGSPFTVIGNAMLLDAIAMGKYKVTSSYIPAAGNYSAVHRKFKYNPKKEVDLTGIQFDKLLHLLRPKNSTTALVPVKDQAFTSNNINLESESLFENVNTGYVYMTFDDFLALDDKAREEMGNIMISDGHRIKVLDIFPITGMKYIGGELSVDILLTDEDAIDDFEDYMWKTYNLQFDILNYGD